MSVLYTLDTFTGAPAPTLGPGITPVAPMPLASNVRVYTPVNWPLAFSAGQFFEWDVSMSDGNVHKQRWIFLSSTVVAFQTQSTDPNWIISNGGSGWRQIGTLTVGVGSAYPLFGTYGHLSFRYRNTGGNTEIALGGRGRCPLNGTDNHAQFFSVPGTSSATVSVFSTNVGSGSSTRILGADIESRVPDGGGEPFLQNGSWTQQIPIRNFGGVDSEGWFGIRDQKLWHQFNAPAVNLDFDEYTVQGLALIGTDYSVEGTLTFLTNVADYAGVTSRKTSGYGYELRIQTKRTSPARSSILQLYRRSSAGLALLASQVLGSTPVGSVKLKLCVQGNVVTGYMNDSLRFTYTDTDPNALSSGNPGIIMRDEFSVGATTSTCDFSGVCFTRFQVAGGGDPGGGGGDPGGGGGTPAFQNVFKNLAYRQFLSPSPITDAVKTFKNLAWRTAISGWNFRNQKWRLMPQSTDDGDTTGDPGDPGIPDLGCIEPGVLVPISPPPSPLTTKIFFAYQLPPDSINNSPWNAAFVALGGWTVGDLAVAVARGGYLIVSQGGYTKFQTAGAYDPAKMDAWIMSHAAYFSNLNAAMASGTLYGIQIADDFASPDLWPPSGLSNAELSRIAAFWRAAYGWTSIRLLLRARTTQIMARPGTLTGVDTLISQYADRLNMSYSAFHTSELAAAPGCNISGILWSQNYMNGGDGSSGLIGTQAGQYICSPSEVQLWGQEFSGGDAYIHGAGGWRYDTRFISIAGMVAALTDTRNRLALL